MAPNFLRQQPWFQSHSTCYLHEKTRCFKCFNSFIRNAFHLQIQRETFLRKWNARNTQSNVSLKLCNCLHTVSTNFAAIEFNNQILELSSCLVLVLHTESNIPVSYTCIHSPGHKDISYQRSFLKTTILKQVSNLMLGQLYQKLTELRRS